MKGLAEGWNVGRIAEGLLNDGCTVTFGGLFSFSICDLLASVSCWPLPALVVVVVADVVGSGAAGFVSLLLALVLLGGADMSSSFTDVSDSTVLARFGDGTLRSSSLSSEASKSVAKRLQRDKGI